MKPRNRYLARSHISAKKFRQFVKAFSLDLTAVQIAKLTGLNRNTVNRLCRIVRERMAADCEEHDPLRGTVEVDESYFGPRRVRGRRGRGAGRKTIVFGILKRNGWVYTRIVPNAQATVLLSIIKQKVRSGTIVNSDGWTSYDGLVDMGYRKHWRVHHSKNEFARGKAHVNGIENFWGLAKVRLMKYRGMHPQTFNFHLKESEFRFNHRNGDLYRAILALFSKEKGRI